MGFSYRIFVYSFVLCLLCSFPVNADVFTQTDSHYYVSFDTRAFLVEPRSIAISDSGQIAIWDHGLQQFIIHSLADTDPETNRSSRSFSSILHQRHTTHLADTLNFSSIPEFFWSQNSLWTYDPQLAQKDGTHAISSISDTKTSKIRGAFHSIAPSGKNWIIQTSDSHQRFLRWNPTRNEIIDTTSFSQRGNLVRITQNNQFITVENNEVRIYENDSLKKSRIFPKLKALSIRDGKIYVLAGNQRIIRVNKNLTVKHTFQIDSSETFNDFSVFNGNAYMVGNEGLFQMPLEESKRSFFVQNSRKVPQKLVGIFPRIDKRSHGRRLWIQENADTIQIQVKINSDQFQTLNFHDTQFSETSRARKSPQLSRSAYQYFQVDSTYWNGKDRLYYYFPDEQTVEAYDRSGQILNRTRIKFDEIRFDTSLKFIGADSNRLLFRGYGLHPKYGRKKYLFIFTWNGTLKRKTRLFRTSQHEPIQSKESESKWWYDGQKTIYVIHDNFIQQYDLKGFPLQTLSTVHKPVSLAQIKDQLFVLDMNGWRVQSFDIPEQTPVRFATPKQSLHISEVTNAGPKRSIFSAYRDGAKNKKQLLFEYNSGTREFQTVLDHPSQRLRYPVVANSGDTLYFWGRNIKTEEKWRLYRSDMRQYSAQPLSHRFLITENEFYDSTNDRLFFRAKTHSDSPPAIWYVRPGDTESKLHNSTRLTDLHPGEFPGYYAIVQTDTRNHLVAGTLEQHAETGPLHWSPADTLYSSKGTIDNIHSTGDRLYLSEHIAPDHHRLLKLTVQPKGKSTGFEYSDKQSLNPKVTVNPVLTASEKLSLRKITADFYRVLVQPDPTQGVLLEVYRNQGNPTGGLQGQLTSKEPINLQGISLTVEPGGETFKTENTGRFSISKLPVGYVEILPANYRYHLGFPMRVPIRNNQFTVRSSIPLARTEELLLLERGLDYWDDQKPRRAQIAIEAFRELIQSGPYYNWTNNVLEILYKNQNDTEALYTLFERKPELFSTHERIELLRTQSDFGNKIRILKSLRDVTDGFLKRLLHRKIRILKPVSESENTVISHQRPVYRSQKGYPHLREKIN